jgi:DnaJ-domain-containing protein 1
MLHWIQRNFYSIQVAFGASLLAIVWIFLRPKEPESRFKLREADRPASKTKFASSGSDTLADAKLKRASTLSLPGIRLEGTPAQILGVSAEASRDQIQKAYRDLMKRYHPDRVARPGTSEWTNAQKIAEIINRAKDELLKGRR